ncbi:NHL repeat-containing protein [Spongiactinospora rosea]|uniref:hypothetical protein n=1 Tax=Spongiactinospora rosea TaxID=2248750 RepID=UPI0011C03D2D|nr:hypothetical protein [Spongiactinospora rosea]
MTDGERWDTLPPGVPGSLEWSHSGIALDSEGNLYWAHPGGGALLVRRAPDGDVERIEVPLLEIHGITYDPSGGGALWLADPGFKARPPDYDFEARQGCAGRFDLATREFTALRPPSHPAYAGDSWRPTSIAINGPAVYVADGYGASLVHIYGERGHEKTIDGTESGKAFACPHGVAIAESERGPELVVADRVNRRLMTFGPDGDHRGSFTDARLRAPSCLAVRGGELIVTDLDGALTAVDLERGALRHIIPFPAAGKREGWPNDRRGDTLKRPELVAGTLNSPHGVTVGPDGSIYLTEYVIGGREVRLTPRQAETPPRLR